MSFISKILIYLFPNTIEDLGNCAVSNYIENLKKEKEIFREIKQQSALNKKVITVGQSGKWTVGTIVGFLPKSNCIPIVQTEDEGEVMAFGMTIPHTSELEDLFENNDGSLLYEAISGQNKLFY